MFMPGAVFLEGDKVNLRTIEEQDIEFLSRELNNPAVWKNISVSEPQNMEQQRGFFEEVVSGDESVNLAISHDNSIVGIISLIPEGDEGVAKLGLWVAEDQHGNGYGTEASQIITEYGFNELRYHKIIARAHENNEGSQKIWEKLGFKQEGVLRDQHFSGGEFQDMYYYGILEDEWEY